MIDPRNGFINHLTDTALVQIRIEFLEQLDDVSRSDLCVHQQPSIGQTLMGVEGRAHDVGWQNGVKMMPHEEQQRMVFEAVAVVVHIVAI